MEVYVFQIMANSIGLAVVLSFFGALVRALHMYNKERRNIPPDFDLVDFATIVSTGTFIGVLAYFVSTEVTDNENVQHLVGAGCALLGMAVILDLGERFLAKYIGVVKVATHRRHPDKPDEVASRPPNAVDSPLPPRERRVSGTNANN